MMKLFTIAFIVLTILLMAAAWAWVVYGAPLIGCKTEDAIGIYQANARTPIFSGFLTMGSLLLALKTNILARLKESYETDKYRKRYIAAEEGGKSGRFFEPLERLGKALGWNVIFCLITSFLQMTLGFWSKPIPFAIASGSAAGCLLLLLVLTYQLMIAHENWFEKIEADAQTELNKLRKNPKH